jgi:hypothetical protein
MTIDSHNLGEVIRERNVTFRNEWVPSCCIVDQKLCQTALDSFKTETVYCLSKSDQKLKVVVVYSIRHFIGFLYK